MLYLFLPRQFPILRVSSIISPNLVNNSPAETCATQQAISNALSPLADLAMLQASWDSRRLHLFPSFRKIKCCSVFPVLHFWLLDQSVVIRDPKYSLFQASKWHSSLLVMHLNFAIPQALFPHYQLQNCWGQFWCERDSDFSNLHITFYTSQLPQSKRIFCAQATESDRSAQHAVQAQFIYALQTQPSFLLFSQLFTCYSYLEIPVL